MPESPLLAPSDLESFRSGDADLNLEAAVAEIRSQCRWHIAPVRTETLTLQASSGVAILPTLRATGVVVVIGGVTLDASAYTLEPGLLRLHHSWRGTGEVTVTLTHGYDELPADLKRVALSMADTGTNPDGRLKSAGPFTYEFTDGESDANVVARHTLASRP